MPPPLIFLFAVPAFSLAIIIAEFPAIAIDMETPGASYTVVVVGFFREILRTTHWSQRGGRRWQFGNVRAVGCLHARGSVRSLGGYKCSPHFKEPFGGGS
jgi:hypothetical protein